MVKASKQIVTIRWREVIFIITIVGFAFACVLRNQNAKADSSIERDYWLWPERHLPSDARVGILYLLQGEFQKRRLDNSLVFINQGIAPRQLGNLKGLILVYRLRSIQAAAPVINQYTYDYERWSKWAPVLGMQLDFDAASGRLNQYGEFLEEIRSKIPTDQFLGITGLMDWLNKDLSELDKVELDEIAFQTYQGSANVPQLSIYLSRLESQLPLLSTSIKLGVLSNETELASVLQNRFGRFDQFKGVVNFVLPGQM